MIRRARESDADAVTALLAQLDYPFGVDAVGPVLAEVLADPAHVALVAEEDEDVVGFVNAHFRPQLHHLAPVGTIDELVVDGDRRGRRIGKRLVEEVLAEARRPRRTAGVAAARPIRSAPRCAPAGARVRSALAPRVRSTRSWACRRGGWSRRRERRGPRPGRASPTRPGRP